jgi:hypothetical protein
MRVNQALLSALLLFPAIAFAQLKTNASLAAEFKIMTDPAQVMNKAIAFADKEDWANYAVGVRRAVELRPYRSDLLFELSRACALVDDKTCSYDALLKLQEQGMTYNPKDDPDFKKVATTEVWSYVIKGLTSNKVPFGGGKPAFTISSDMELIESITYDQKSGHFFVGSALSGIIMAVDKLGKPLSMIKSPGDWGVYSLLMDNKLGQLWVGSSAASLAGSGATAQTLTQAAILVFDVKSGKLLKTYPLPVTGKPHIPSAIAQAPNGDIYFTNAVNNYVYQIHGDKLRPLFSAPEFTSLRGIAINANGKILYLSDYETGIYAADLNKSQVYRMDMPKQNLGGVDGLYFSANQLFILQNATEPKRVMRLKLEAEGNKISAVTPVEAGKAEITAPTFGVIVGNDLFYIANSQRDVYDGQGTILSGVKPTRRIIFRTPLNFAANAAARPDITNIKRK